MKDLKKCLRTDIAGLIDHTILRSNATTEDVRQVCAEARENGFASVCVNPSFVSLVADELDGTKVGTCCVVAFPLGAATPTVKAFETVKAIADGADEIDMVVNIGAVKEAHWDAVAEDIRAVVEAANGKALVKVILETCLLTDDEKVRVCEIAKDQGADFVKTSTGFSIGGATVHDVELMRKTVGPEMGVKASGGIHTWKEAHDLIKAGATRIGTSSGMAIVAGGPG